MASKVSLHFLVENLESFMASVCSEDPEGKKLRQAMNEVDNAALHNFAEFMHSMSVILANYETFSIGARRGAALQLRQRLTNKDSHVRNELRKQWLAVPIEIRNEVKSNTLAALRAPQRLRPNSSSQLVAYIASIESPITENWPSLVPSLCEMIFQSRDGEKEGPAEALAFICKELSTEMLVCYAKDIKAAILTCVQMKRSSDCIRLAALICLLECFDFTKILLSDDDTFPVVMANICHSAKSICSEIRVGGLSALVKIATYQYECLKDVMDEVETITVEAIRSDHQRTHIQALEFWKTVSQNETPRDAEGRLVNDRGYVYRHGFSEGALEKLVPALLYALKRGDYVQNAPTGNAKHRRSRNEAESYKLIPEEIRSSSDWKTKDVTINGKARERKRKEALLQNECASKGKENKRNATPTASTEWIPPKEVIIYLSELCESFPKAIDAYILPCFRLKIKHQDWKERNLALWSMLVFLQQMKLSHAKDVLPTYFPLVVNAIQDKSSPRIRNTALWVASWMLDKCPWLVVSDDTGFLKKVVNLLLSCLNDEEGRVASTSCITITSFVKASYFIATERAVPHMKPQTFHLSPYFDQIADSLLLAANRRLTAAFEALRQMLIMAPDDCYWIVLDTFDALLIQLRKMIALPETHPVGCDCHETVQQILCNVLRSIFKSLRFGEEPTVQLAWKFMKCIKDIVKLFPHGKAKEDAVLAASTIVSVLGWQVKDHLSWEIPHISSAMSPKSDTDNRTYNL